MDDKIISNFNLWFQKSPTPRWIVFFLDLLICLFSISLAYLLRFNFEIHPDYLQTLAFVIPYVIFIRALSFMIFRTYAGLIRYTSAKDTERIIIVVLFGTLTLALGNILFSNITNSRNLIPYGIVIIDFLITVFIMTASRLLIKSLYLEINNPSSHKTHVIIYGADQFGAITKRTLDRDIGINSKVVAYIDHRKNTIGKKLEGISIYDYKDLPHLLERFAVSKLIIASKNIDPDRKNELIDECLNYDVKVMSVPEVNTWINGELSFNQIRAVKIEDLLERKQIKLDENAIKKQTLNKTILVTGAAGSIGAEIVKQLTKYRPKKIILFDQAESPLYFLELELQEKLHFDDFNIIIGDITHTTKLNTIFKTYNPQIVYHAAAYKHVPMMENHPTEAIRTNVLGTKVLADLSIKHHVEKFVMISTDKAVNPTNIMGASKRLAEIYIQSLNKTSPTNFITTRFGNVLGSQGSVIPRFRKQIEKGGPITLTHPEVTRYFMTIPEAVQLVLEAGAMGHGGEIFIFDMGESIKIIDLAKKMVRLSGLTIGKDIKLSYTGLRPGEKLYEELLNDKENTITTHHPQIMIAKVKEYDHKTVSGQIDDLINLSEKHENYPVVSLMKRLVPEFISENSIYEKLDLEKNQ